MYDHQKIEKKWQKKWAQSGLYTPDLDKAKKPFFNLMMFPYPSAEGLHVGNMYAFTHSDCYGRFKRLQGYDVLEPIGLDGFGIQSENYAIKINEHIREVSRRTEKHFYEQLHQIGNQYDWTRTVETYKENYYKWTQWLFLQLYKKGLAYRKKAPVNWCPSCKTVLSDEQVIAGKCERCDSEVEKKEMEQWFFKITEYAERLLENLSWIDWSEEVKLGQKNWIGKSEGAEIEFGIKAQKAGAGKGATKNVKIKVFTTRPDTVFGATYLVFSPELAQKLLEQKQPFAGLVVENKAEVEKYIKAAFKKDDQERLEEKREKTGKELKGIKAVNPVTDEEVPVWVADYVLAGYGTGAIMAVPAHDERDFAFARKFDLEIKEVVKPKKKLAIIIHGFEGMAQSNFFPWAKQELEKLGCEVVLEDMPNSAHPKMEEWIKALQKHADKIDEETVIIGHSLGGKAAPQLVSRLGKKIKALYLVAPAVLSDSVDFDQWREEWPESDVDCLEAFIKTKTDWNKVKRNAGKVRAIFSDDDPAINLAGKDFFKKQGIETLVLKGRGHLVDPEFPELIDLVAGDSCFAGEGKAVNSDFLDGLETAAAKKKIIKHLEEKKIGEKAVNYKLRDWCVSRQRYWGPPIPMVHCENCGWQPVAEEDLPVKLPELTDFHPDGSGKGPLNKVKEFVETKCPKCGAKAERETDVSDPFVDSSWYFFRYLNTEDNKQALSKERMKKWMPVNLYFGGKEHTVLHLLYARFVTMVFNDLGYIDFEEPFKKFFGHGLVIKDGTKMSKSKGNIVNPDEYIERFGADSVRMYLMFLGDARQGGDWKDAGMAGMFRFAKRVTRLYEIFDEEGERKGQKATSKKTTNLAVLHKTIKSVGEDLERFSFNTAIARIMELANWYSKEEKRLDQTAKREILERLAIIISPFAPHLGEEFWERLGHKESVFKQKWPAFEESLIKAEQIELVVQINGKVRSRITADAEISEEKAFKLALEDEKIKSHLAGGTIKKKIFVKGKLVSLVV